MCTTAFAFGVHPTILFFLAFNRDEFLDRYSTLVLAALSFELSDISPLNMPCTRKKMFVTE